MNITTWMANIIAQWRAKQNDIVFEDGFSSTYRPTTLPTTTETTHETFEITTTESASSSIITTEPTYLKNVSGGVPSELTVIIAITCATLLGFAIMIVTVIWCCRRSARKDEQRISLHRPLHKADEENIYAEISPLQNAAKGPCNGASGTSSDIILPSRKRRRGFREISTRIYKFFSSDLDRHVISYDKSEDIVAVGQPLPPAPPNRDSNKRRWKHDRNVQCEDSSASCKRLLDKETHASVSSGSERRNNIYNPLIIEKLNQEVGLYDHLTLSKTPSGRIIDCNSDPLSEHDYFILATSEHDNEADTNKNVGCNVEITVPADNSVSQVDKDSSINLEDSEKVDISNNHDYFVLQSDQKQNEDIERKDEDILTSSKNSIINHEMSSHYKNISSYSPISDTNTKWEEKANVEESTNFNEDSDPKQISHLIENTSSDYKHLETDLDKTKVVDTLDNSTGDAYELSKFDKAPEPPTIKDDGEYMRPVHVNGKPDYIDVFPLPHSISESKHSHELAEKYNIHKSASIRNDMPLMIN